MEAQQSVADEQVRHFPRGRELAAIGAFWTAFAALNVTNFFFPPSGQGPPFTPRAVGVSVFDSFLWALATPIIFFVASRYGAERAPRIQRILLYILLGIVVAVSIDVLVELMRRYGAPPSPRRGGRGRGPSGFIRGRFLNEYVVFIAVLAAGIARDYFARYQRRLEESVRLRAQLAEARFMVLQSQLNPHFLFNTLNAVATLVDRDPRGVRRMIARLSELLRATLEPSTEPEITLGREMSLTQRYLEILEIRFQDRLTTSIELPPDLQSALVPKLILQPLVENAMQHAVGQTSEPSRIDVRARRDGYDLVLCVEDTGAGSNDAQPTGERPAGTGIGLRNTRARLEQLYGDEQRLSLDPNDVGGTTVEIRLPYHTAAELQPAPSAVSP